MYSVIALILETKKGDNVKYLGKVGVTVKYENGEETVTITDDYPGNIKGFVEMKSYDDVDFIREFVERAHRFGKAKSDWLNVPKLR